MDQLQNGDILKRISDGSKWKFVHYKPIQTDYGQSEDKNLIHVKEWDVENENWKHWDTEGGHEEYPVTEFEKA